ncbi:RDD family protein [Lentibacillus salinarum]|uniref:RDD family protein n=1 Tax=Lentibacillus salinarum TaxID=446820 RepID=A0ABW3ZY84_9BACI
MALLDEYRVELQANEFEPAGVIRRGIAIIIDFAICGAAWAGINHYGLEVLPYQTILDLIGLGFCLLYFALLNRYSYGQTIGKRAMSIAIMPKTGGILNWTQSLWRAPLLLVSAGIWGLIFRDINPDIGGAITAIVLFGNMGIIIVSRNKRGFHDYLFGTYVVKKKAQNIVTINK